MNSREIEEFLSELKAYWISNDIPNVTEKGAQFLKDMIKIKKPKNILEIWTANWYSTIQMWIVAQKIWTKITTIEFSPLSRKQALNNFKTVWFDNFINSLEWNALDIIPTLEEKYDFIFIDWMKKRYLDFLNLIWDKTESWWVIILDDVIKFKHKMENFYEFLKEKNIKYNLLPIDEDDGVILLVR